MNSRKRFLRAGIVFVSLSAALLFLASAYLGVAQAATAPSLGTAASFAVLGSSEVTNTGATIVNGNLGVSPGSDITGFPPGIVVPPGTINSANAVASQAQTNVTSAYNNLAGQACNFNLTGQDLGGLTLTPGVYCFPNTSAQLTGPLTLDAQNSANAVFVFQIGSTLTTASSSSVNVINGGSACNVFWQVGSSATLGTNTAFKGNILALASITLNTGSSIAPGRALARTAAVTMDTNTVTMAACNLTTPPPATQTAVAATQTAIAPTLTAIAPTLTAVAATQTAIAPTRTPTRTGTPLSVCPIAETVKPTGMLTATGTDGLGNKFIRVTARDIGSGIATIVVTKSVNAATVVASFVIGTTQPVIITSTKINANLASTVEVRITDRCGNTILADPVLTLLQVQDGNRFEQTFKGIPPQEHFVTVTNDASGLRGLRILVNGTKFQMKKLKSNEVRLLDISSAMTKKKNRIVLLGTGPTGSNAFIVIGDSFLEQPDALAGFTEAHAQNPQDNLTWGAVDSAE